MAIIHSHKLHFLSETLKVCKDLDIFKIFKLVKFTNLKITAELGIPNEIQYFGTTGDTFRYRNNEYNISTDTDADWMIPNDFLRYL